jgi:uncharacterized protein with HEPN domain
MYDKELALEVLSQISHAAQTVMRRFKPIKSPDDFTDSPSGMEKLDSICMQLIAIGEGLKNLDKITNSSLLNEYKQIDWKKAKALRDIISHHYFKIDAEAIFEVCKDNIPELADTIDIIMADIS